MASALAGSAMTILPAQSWHLAQPPASAIQERIGASCHGRCGLASAIDEGGTPRKGAWYCAAPGNNSLAIAIKPAT